MRSAVVYSAVRFFTPFEDFAESPLPSSGDAYKSYMRLAIEFIEARNRRIDSEQPLGTEARSDPWIEPVEALAVSGARRVSERTADVARRW